LARQVKPIVVRSLIVWIVRFFLLILLNLCNRIKLTIAIIRIPLIRRISLAVCLIILLATRVRVLRGRRVVLVGVDVWLCGGNVGFLLGWWVGVLVRAVVGVVGGLLLLVVGLGVVWGFGVWLVWVGFFVEGLVGWVGGRGWLLGGLLGLGLWDVS
jgi:hypothetical protein